MKNTPESTQALLAGIAELEQKLAVCEKQSEEQRLLREEDPDGGR